MKLSKATHTKFIICNHTIDQQDCVIWHLYLSSEGEECVLASHTYLDLVYTDPDEFDNITEQEAVAQTWICAPSFEAFLYRFWMENVLWFNLHKHKPLTEEQQEYLAFYGEEQPEENRFARYKRLTS